MFQSLFLEVPVAKILSLVGKTIFVFYNSPMVALAKMLFCKDLGTFSV
jgi:hypothetical protein